MNDDLAVDSAEDVNTIDEIGSHDDDDAGKEGVAHRLAPLRRP